MKKEFISPKQVSEKMLLENKKTYFVDPKPEDCIKIVNTAKEYGIEVGNETERYPYDRQYPYIVWNGKYVTQSKKREDHYEGVSVDEFIQIIKDTKEHTIRLNDAYIGLIKKDELIVGCQTIPMSVVQEIVKRHKKLY